MIRHCSLWKFKEGVTPELIDEMAAAFARAIEHIPSAISGRFGRNVGYMDDNYDFAINIEFEDVDGYRAYVAHELHRELSARYLRPNAQSRAGLQFELT